MVDASRKCRPLIINGQSTRADRAFSLPKPKPWASSSSRAQARQMQRMHGRVVEGMEALSPATEESNI